MPAFPRKRGLETIKQVFGKSSFHVSLFAFHVFFSLTKYKYIFIVEDILA